MEKQQKRPSMKEINASIDAILKRKPTKKQIEELGEVIRKNNEENEANDSDLQTINEGGPSPNHLNIKGFPA